MHSERAEGAGGHAVKWTNSEDLGRAYGVPVSIGYETAATGPGSLRGPGGHP